MTLEELYLKHHILSDGLQRRYIISTAERRYDLDFVTPIELHFIAPTGISSEYSKPKEVVFKNRSWVQIVKELGIYLQTHFNKAKEELYNYRTDWSKAPIYSNHQSIDNMVEIESDLFLSVNFTATHFSWIIGDLLSLYNIHVGCLVVHRTPISEPQEIKDVVGNFRRIEFKEFLVSVKYKTDEKADKIIKNIEVMNKILVKMGTSYNDFFLFDDTLMLSNFKSKLLSKCYKYVHWTDSQIETAKKYLGYLTDYYTNVMKESKCNKNNVEFHFPII